MKILGIRVDNISKEELYNKVNSFLNDGKFYQVASINPEIILLAEKSQEFKNILNKCDLNIADGIGLKYAFWKSGKKLKARITGIDLMWRLLKIADEKSISVFLAARSDGLSTWQETRDAIKNKYPHLEISGDNINTENTKYKIQNTNHCMLFCNFGASYQEKFIQSLKNDIIGIAFGVGGSFDFITGKIRRAPQWMRSIGIEWFWRLLLQPRRIGRIWNAVIVFPIKVFLNLKQQ